MANTGITRNDLPGMTIYGTVKDRAGQIWDTTGTPAFETQDIDQWNDNYAIAASEVGTYTGVYILTFPSGIGPGRYQVALYQQVAGKKHQSDPLVELREVEWDGAAIPDQNLYHADIDWIPDSANSQDDVTVRWFLNGARITSGITLPLIQVVNRADGADRIAETAMDGEVGSTGMYKHDVSGASRIGSGEAIEVIISATIDGAVRTFSRVFSIR